MQPHSPKHQSVLDFKRGPAEIVLYSDYFWATGFKQKSWCIYIFLNHIYFLSFEFISVFYFMEYFFTTSDGSGSKIFDPGWVGSATFGLSLGLEKFPLKISNFQFFPLRITKNLFRLGNKVPGSKTGRHFIYCGSKVCLGQFQGPSLCPL